MPNYTPDNFAFYEQLQHYYHANRRKIRARYNDLTRKFLAYNDCAENPTAYLRQPQFEALEMYIFIKEFLGNAQVYEIFDDWRNRRARFADATIYSVSRDGQMRLMVRTHGSSQRRMAIIEVIAICLLRPIVQLL